MATESILKTYSDSSKQLAASINSQVSKFLHYIYEENQNNDEKIFKV